VKEIKPSIKTRILSFFASIIVTIVLLNNLLTDMIVRKLNEIEENLKSWK